jgi:hypothetical protein
MGEIILHEPLASQLRQQAEAEGVKVESLIESALRHYRFQSQRRKIDAESVWWQGVASDVRAQYAGEFVAIHNQSVIDHDRDEEALRKRIRSKYGKTAVLITPAAGRRELRVVSTNLARP